MLQRTQQSWVSISTQVKYLACALLSWSLACAKRANWWCDSVSLSNQVCLAFSFRPTSFVHITFSYFNIFIDQRSVRSKLLNRYDNNLQLIYSQTNSTITRISFPIMRQCWILSTLLFSPGIQFVHVLSSKTLSALLRALIINFILIFCSLRFWSILQPFGNCTEKHCLWFGRFCAFLLCCGAHLHAPIANAVTWHFLSIMLLQQLFSSSLLASCLEKNITFFVGRKRIWPITGSIVSPV